MGLIWKQKNKDKCTDIMSSQLTREGEKTKPNKHQLWVQFGFGGQIKQDRWRSNITQGLNYCVKTIWMIFNITLSLSLSAERCQKHSLIQVYKC